MNAMVVALVMSIIVVTQGQGAARLSPLGRGFLREASESSSRFPPLPGAEKFFKKQQVVNMRRLRRIQRMPQVQQPALLDQELVKAVIAQNKEHVEAVLAKIASLSEAERLHLLLKQYEGGKTVLHMAVDGALSLIKKEITQQGIIKALLYNTLFSVEEKIALLSMADDTGHIPLWYAVNAENPALVSALLQKLAPVDAATLITFDIERLVASRLAHPAEQVKVFSLMAISTKFTRVRTAGLIAAAFEKEASIS